MILLIRKKTLRLSAAAACLLCCVSLFAGTLKKPAVPVFGTASGERVTVIVDPGHGGVDGGAVSPSGVTESPLNLAVSLRVNDLLRFWGQPTAMTRADENAIHTEGDTIRARKASDTRNRVSLVNETPGAVLLSIHQNSLPSSPATHGAQVFYNREEGAEALALSVQDSLNTVVNPGNEKHCKPIPATIYLMNHVTRPAVLVECGFLSNAEETARLQEPSYQLKLAAAITSGCLACFAGEEVP